MADFVAQLFDLAGEVFRGIRHCEDYSSDISKVACVHAGLWLTWERSIVRAVEGPSGIQKSWVNYEVRPERMMKAVFLFLFLSVASSILAIAENSTPERQTPTISGKLEGPRTAVLDTRKDSCELIDIPDAPARAFRDYKGTVHLVASHYKMRQNLGPTLENAKHSCHVAYNSAHDPTPANYNDSTWLDSFYSLDGKKIVALGHMEYHGWEHKGECHTQNDDQCWYNADTLHYSDDGGYNFKSFTPPDNYFVGLPFKYVVDDGPEGYSVDTNIVKVGKWYYAMATDWNWPPNCQSGDPEAKCKVPFGGAPIRSDNPLDASSWRGWNGTDFSLTFVDPYLGPVKNPEAHVYTPVPYMYYVNAVNIYEPAHIFVATLWDPWNTAYGPEGLYLSTSTDFVNWTTPTLVISQADLLAKEPKGNWSYLYFSLLDPNAKDANFQTWSNHVDLFYVRMDNDHPPYRRVLFRQRVKLSANP
jgi:hypothetical protein